MDGFDNPDHGRSIYNMNGVIVKENPFIPSEVHQSSSVPPEGGPNFPALEDVQISSVPT